MIARDWFTGANSDGAKVVIGIEKNSPSKAKTSLKRERPADDDDNTGPPPARRKII